MQIFTKSFTIGRGAQCEVRLDVKNVSRLHARVVFEKGQWCVQDTGSVNGLYVEGQQMKQVDLSEPTTLRLGLNGPVVHLSVAHSEPEAPPQWADADTLRQEPAAPARFEPEMPAEAEFRAPLPAAPWPQPPAKVPPAPPPAEAVHPEPQAKVPPAPVPPVPPRPKPTAQIVPPEPASAFPKPYRADRFTFSLIENWTDETVHILQGPVTDGLQHTITIHIEPTVSVDGLLDYADRQIQTLKTALNGCLLLKTDQVELVSGLPAYRAIFVWRPAADLRLYQEQLYVLHQQTGYTLTATFTKKTRKTLGPQVEQIMVSFTPEERSSSESILFKE